MRGRARLRDGALAAGHEVLARGVPLSVGRSRSVRARRLRARRRGGRLASHASARAALRTFGRAHLRVPYTVGVDPAARDPRRCGGAHRRHPLRHRAVSLRPRCPLPLRGRRRLRRSLRVRLRDRGRHPRSRSLFGASHAALVRARSRGEVGESAPRTPLKTMHPECGADVMPVARAAKDRRIEQGRTCPR